MPLSDVIANSFEDLKSLKQRPDYHPEKWVFDHEAYVWFQLRNMLDGREQREMMLVAAFHDIGKIPTTDRKAEDKGGYITSYQHAEKSKVYWDAVAPAFEEWDVRTDVIGWLIKEHMNFKFLDRQNDRTKHEKKEAAKDLGNRVWTMGNLFAQADDMLAFFDKNSMDYRLDVAAGDDHLDPLDKHEEAIGRFGDYVSEIVNQIRSWEDSGSGKDLTLVRGVPGCGKTTFAHKMLSRHGKSIATDEFFETDDGYDFDPSKLGEAHEWCRSQVEGMMQDGAVDIAVHNTFTQVWEMLDYYTLAAKYGYRVYSVVVENRHRGESSHGVPQSARNKMENRFETRLQ